MGTGKLSFPILCSLGSKEPVIDSSFLEGWVLESESARTLPKGLSRQSRASEGGCPLTLILFQTPTLTFSKVKGEDLRRFPRVML